MMNDCNKDFLPLCLRLLRELSSQMSVMRDALLRYDVSVVERQCDVQQSLCREVRIALRNSQATLDTGASQDDLDHELDSDLAKQFRTAAEEVRRLNRQQSVLAESGLRALRVRSNLVMLTAPALAARNRSRSFACAVED
jgi:hypothetical protein